MVPSRQRRPTKRFRWPSANLILMVPVADSLVQLAFSKIARRVFPDARLLSHRPLKGGVSAAVHVLDVSTPRGPTSLVVRRHGAASWKQLPDDVTQAEFRLLAALHEACFPVPEPLLLDTDAHLLPSPYFVMQFVDGSSDIPQSFLDSALRQMATLLARLHALDPRVLSLPSLPDREDPIDGALRFIPDNESTAQLREVVSFLRLHRPSPVLLHGDFWPGNILWNRGTIVAIVDWEDAALGPAASDVACCRAELNVLFGLSAACSFTEYYRTASSDALEDLPIWDLYVSSAALASLHEWGLPADVEANRRERTAEFLDHAVATLLRA